ncbi:MAG: hypothetical protein KJP10_11085 [Gammaproteobacteria bacterium]|nr:hypothetical protein [Gammaproteobacteria bacterium]
MKLNRYLLAALLLTFSGQSLALFMPDDFKINTDTSVVDDGGCGLMVTVKNSLKS